MFYSPRRTRIPGTVYDIENMYVDMLPPESSGDNVVKFYVLLLKLYFVYDDESMHHVRKARQLILYAHIQNSTRVDEGRKC